MIKKIISGGQTGAAQAALDVAIKLGIPHGGWIPKGRRTENGPLPAKYELLEMPTASYARRTEENVIDSDGTLIVSHGKLSGGTAFTRKCAEHYCRPCLHIDLRKIDGFEAAKAIGNWIVENRIEILNVAGPRASKDPAIYESTKNLLEAAFYMDIIEAELPDPEAMSLYLPRSLDEAVDLLIAGLSLKDKTNIAHMEEDELHLLPPSLGRYIRDKFGLWRVNKELMDSCRLASVIADLDEDDCSALIIRELWKRLRETFYLRVVR